MPLITWIGAAQHAVADEPKPGHVLIELGQPVGIAAHQHDMGQAVRMNRRRRDGAQLRVGLQMGIAVGWRAMRIPRAGDKLNLAMQNVPPVAHGVDIELDHVAVGIEHIDAVRDLMIGEAADRQSRREAAVVARDELRLVVELPGDVIEAGLGAEFLGDLQMAVAAIAVLALRGLDAADVVRRVTGAEKAALQVGLDEFQREAANGIVELGRAPEIIDEEIHMAKPACPEDRKLDVSKHLSFLPHARNSSHPHLARILLAPARQFRYA